MALQFALVTGASQGIGRAIALRLAEDGFDVAINDLPSTQGELDTLAQEIISIGRKALTVVGDVSDEADVQHMISSVVEEFGELNVMVANAGVCVTKAVVDTTVDEWDRLFRVNARGVFLCYKHAAAQMIKQGRGGRLIGASSVAGQRGEMFLGGYSATKFAVRGLTQAAAAELGRHRITVNAYCPGTIETTMLKSIGEVLGSAEQFLEQCAKECMVGYNGTPADVAGLVSYLASKEAHFVTGQSFGINGGRLAQ